MNDLSPSSRLSEATLDEWIKEYVNRSERDQTVDKHGVRVMRLIAEIRMLHAKIAEIGDKNSMLTGESNSTPSQPTVRVSCAQVIAKPTLRQRIAHACGENGMRLDSFQRNDNPRASMRRGGIITVTIYGGALDSPFWTYSSIAPTHIIDGDAIDTAHYDDILAKITGPIRWRRP